MTIFKYLHDKILLILFHLMGMLLLGAFLLSMGNTLVTVGLIEIFWLIALSGFLVYDFWKRKKFFAKINGQLAQLDKPYLLSELMEKSWYYQDQLYKEIIEQVSKSALESIAHLEVQQDEYKAFIEAWIHEVKLPITSIYLAVDSVEIQQKQRIIYYLTELENQVEQALFYARSEQVYKDYFIQEISLATVVKNLVKKNKYLLIQNHMEVTLDCEAQVLADEKWLSFIINQIIFNAVKYKKAESGKLEFYTVVSDDKTELMIKDYGIGIKAEELARVFEKGFTGSNGRMIGKSTGIGLYLCKKLCQKLSLQIQIESLENEYTQVTLVFPRNTYISKL
ncbi:signal transduction histidine kinase [Enterococcus sp. PF1-24]|uniref:sensor histidine kinase n=1 Tax=unclassified Enterococcus TaxID=2608891 RepID=UPI002474C78B|nr:MULTISPECIES: sensor histidine kinase [unclassified Enterococcus]MDH6364174.1 signal transduction histidine kinase [Enterococcus sp. PFB1-1]MDH6401275.1 signal transduction histidine kinase [Enterococcus sp. PF1-24]